MSWSNGFRLQSSFWGNEWGVLGRMQRARRRKRQHAGAPRQAARCGCLIETLEGRLLLSATASPTFILMSRGSSGITPKASAGVAPIDPAQMRAAYGVNQISFGGTAGTGAGQTIAIVDAYNDPDILSDANSLP
ncbi:MAG TPA: LEPR-XLL domain-containing protein, partial [Planctomycetaceae bacterium]|nr:LEPR-XLL domain-containing protein [Planctomycetaceae bacterium]